MNDVLTVLSFYTSAVAALISVVATFLAYRSHRLASRSLRSKLGPLHSDAVVEEFSQEEKPPRSRDLTDEDKP